MDFLWDDIIIDIITKKYENAEIKLIEYSKYLFLKKIEINRILSFDYIWKLNYDSIYEILENQIVLGQTTMRDSKTFQFINYIYDKIFFDFRDLRESYISKNIVLYLEIIKLFTLNRNVSFLKLVQYSYEYLWNIYKKNIKDKITNNYLNLLINLIKNYFNESEIIIFINETATSMFTHCFCKNERIIQLMLNDSINLTRKNFLTLYYFLKMKSIYIPNFKVNSRLLEKVVKKYVSVHGLRFLPHNKINNIRDIFLDIIIQYIEVTPITYEIFVKYDIPICNSLKNMEMNIHEKIMLFLRHKNFAENIMDNNACNIVIDYFNYDSKNIMIDFLKFKQYRLTDNNIEQILIKCLNEKTVSFVLKNNNITEEMLKNIILSNNQYNKSFLLTAFYKNYLNYNKYDEEESEELNEKYLTYIEPNDKIIKNELKNKISKFFNIQKNTCFEEMLKKMLDYLIKNELIIEKYFIIDEKLNELLNIEVNATMHINTLSNIVTHFYL